MAQREIREEYLAAGCMAAAGAILVFGGLFSILETQMALVLASMMLVAAALLGLLGKRASCVEKSHGRDPHAAPCFGLRRVLERRETAEADCS